MKDKLIILFFVLIMKSCTPQVNTSDPQVSESSLESKKNNLFLKYYSLKFSKDNNITIGETWLEKGWFNEIHNGKVEIAQQKYCQLCFKLKVNPKSKYNKMNLGKSWLLKNVNSNRYVGIINGICTISFDHCEDMSSIELELISRENNGYKKVVVGKLLFTELK